MTNRLTVSRTIEELAGFRPVLEPMLSMFRPLLEARASLAESLVPSISEGGFSLPAWDSEKGRQGVPLLRSADLSGLEKAAGTAAAALLPILEGLRPFEAWKPALRAFLSDIPAFLRLSEAFLDGRDEALAEAAEASGMPPAAVLFVLESVLGPVIRAASGAEAPWDSHPAAWRSGECPVCGSAPIIGYLEPKPLDEDNPALYGGGGGQHLLCGTCGTEWHFRRGCCPVCGAEDEGVLQTLQVEGINRGERLVWCTKCGSYYPVIDLRERIGWPDPATMAPGMVHLDIIAAERGLQPARPSFWNQFQA